MIAWCRKCDTQPLDSYDQIFGNGACVHCIAEGVGKAFDKAILFGQEESLTEKIRRARERRTSLPYYTAPYIGPNSLVGVAINGEIFTDTYENMVKPKKSLESLINESIRKSRWLFDTREWELVVYGPHHDIPNIIRSEN